MSNVSGNYKLHPKQWRAIERQLESECSDFKRKVKERAETWGPRVYHAVTPVEHIDLCATVPEGFINRATGFDVSLDNFELRLKLPHPMPMDRDLLGPYHSLSLRPEHHLEAYHALLAIAREARKADDDGDWMVEELKNVYAGCTTLKELVVIWPDCMRYMTGAVKTYKFPTKNIPEPKFVLSDRTKVHLVKLKLMRT